jgi:hypothetical protein
MKGSSFFAFSINFSFPYTHFSHKTVCFLRGTAATAAASTVAAAAKNYNRLFNWQQIPKQQMETLPAQMAIN